MSVAAGRSITLDGISVPRLAFGYGSLMKWSPERKPMVTDSSAEVGMALEVGFRHLDGGELYLNSESVGQAILSSSSSLSLSRSDLFVSLKINTYANIGFSGPRHIHDAAMKQIEVLGLQGYIDCVQLHFPPRSKKGNLSNREAWRCLEELKEKGIARIIGVSNWEMDDYTDIMEANDLKYAPMISEYEFTPHLNNDPVVRELRDYEEKNGIVGMAFGCLTSLSGKAPADKTVHLRKALESLSQQTGMTQSQLLLRWALDCTKGIVVTSTSKRQRAQEAIDVLEIAPLVSSVRERIEQAALQDGYQDQRFFNLGFFGLNASNLVDLEVITESGDGLGIEDSFNNTLAPYDTCTNSDNITIGDTYLRAVWDPIYLANATTRLQQYITGLNLTTELVYGMQSLCAYETVALGYSNFCSLFTKEEWLGYEYSYPSHSSLVKSEQKFE